MSLPYHKIMNGKASPNSQRTKNASDRKELGQKPEQKLGQKFEQKFGLDFEMNLAHKAQPLVESLRGQVPNGQTLQSWTKDWGVDFATYAFYEAIQKSYLHGEFIKQVNALAKISAPPSGLTGAGRQISNIEIVIVPSCFTAGPLAWGYFVESLRSQARRWGFTTDVIDTHPDFSLTQNASLIEAYLKGRTAENIFLVSFSRGSAEVRMCLQRGQLAKSELAKVKAWINVNGAVHGSLYADLRSKEFFYRKFGPLLPKIFSYNARHDLELSKNFGIYRERFVLPNSMLMVNVLGLPLSHHIPIEVLSDFRSMQAAAGPNDSRVLLTDALIRPGFIYPLLGQSHFLLPEKVDRHFERLFEVLRKTVSLHNSKSSVDVGAVDAIPLSLFERTRQRVRDLDL